MSCSPLTLETVWLDKPKFDDAERFYHERSYKLQWMNSSSKMGEPKSGLKEDGLKNSISIENKKMEPIINALPLEEKVVKEEKKKEEKGAKAAEKKNGASDEAKIGEKGKKKNKEDDAKDKEKEKQNKKKPKEAKKVVKEEKSSEEKKVSGLAAPQASSVDEVSSEGVDAKKGVKKTKKTKNKKNLQAAGDDGSSESAVKKTEKKESGGEQTHKKKADKKESKKEGGVGGAAESEILARLMKLENDNKKMKSLADDVKKMTNNVNQLLSRMSALEKGVKAPANTSASQSSQVKTEEKPKKKDDDDVDLFGSDEEEDVDMLKIKAERLKMYEDKKAKKPGVIAKSNIILDVKPWDDETNMKTMEEKVRLVACDGLLWGASKLVPLAYGIHKLQISCVIEDEKVSVDWLQEQIEANEDLVQSVDIAAFNKV